MHTSEANNSPSSLHYPWFSSRMPSALETNGRPQLIIANPKGTRIIKNTNASQRYPQPRSMAYWLLSTSMISNPLESGYWSCSQHIPQENQFAKSTLPKLAPSLLWTTNKPPTPQSKVEKQNKKSSNKVTHFFFICWRPTMRWQQNQRGCALTSTYPVGHVYSTNGYSSRQFL